MIRANGVLFDIDGTLVQSLAAVERAWATFAVRHGIDPTEMHHKIHGRRSIDSIRLLLPHVDAEQEDIVLRGLESSDTEGVVATHGALDFLQCLNDVPWGVVTSGTSDVANARLQAAGIAGHKIAVYGEEVVAGKPHPEPFLLGANRLKLEPANIVAFEDTAAGVRSAKAAGMQVIGIGRLALEEADLVVEDFTHLRCVPCGTYVEISAAKS